MLRGVRLLYRLKAIKPGLQGVRWIRTSTVRFNENQPVALASDVSFEALQYERLEPKSHILLRPDSYIGSVVVNEELTWLFNSTTGKMEYVNCAYSPGLLKIFDEVLVNAADNKQRDDSMTEIRVNVDQKGGLISVRNDGKGLPISLHPREGVYVPTLIFGTLYTSSNYDDKRLKTVGGRNGFGAKLCNIFSDEFIVETVSSHELFSQSWTNNMDICSDVLLTKSESTDYTKISFRPDVRRFGSDCLDDTIVSIMKRRCIDVAGTLTGVRVFFNDELIQVNSFKDYVSLYVDNCLFFNVSPRWKIALARSSGSFQHATFVNNISTPKGGKHLDYVSQMVVNIIRGEMDRRSGKQSVRTHAIKRHLFLFLNSVIENPSFDSQTKDSLTTQVRNFGSSITLDEKSVIEWANTSGLLDDLQLEIETKRVPRTSRSQSMGLVPKLEDATRAGTFRGHECSLFVTEGDSAKAFAVAGLEVIGRDTFGVFPIRGKLVNVSEIGLAKVGENSEISKLMRILGLNLSCDYASEEDRRRLRYGQLIVLADQDEDGSHIKGLILNLFHCYWPELLRSGYVSSFRTPLIKVRRGTECMSFYSSEEYKQWTKLNVDADTHSVKYYKGLGTSTSAEAREYFSNMSRHLVRYRITGDEDNVSIRMAFDRDQAEKRKRWIEAHCVAGTSNNSHISEKSTNSNRAEIPMNTFINEELIQYSLLDLKRSIPSMVDGLKPSQRKVLHTLLQKSDRKETKVNQLAGAVSLNQAYHHGEESLVNTIVRMAQNFVGSNNIPLLKAIGQFGTRHEGGSDAASARYIFTKLSAITRMLFPQADDRLLTYLKDENQVVEPVWYCPIIPLVLVNGAEGIGTGWATRVLNHSLVSVTDNVRRLIDRKDPLPLVPFWNGFTGQVKVLQDNKYETSGTIHTENGSRGRKSVVISELPIGIWTNRYKERVLSPLLSNGIITDINQLHSERSVGFRFFMGSRYANFSSLQLHKLFKLSSVTSCNSMVLFDVDGGLKRYTSTNAILLDQFSVRKDLYKKRLVHSTEELFAKKQYCQNQLKFIDFFKTYGRDLIHGSSQKEVVSNLLNHGFDPDPIAVNKKIKADFSYLLDTPVSKLSSEEMGRLQQRTERISQQWESVKQMSWQDAWINDLDSMSKEYERWATSNSL